MQILTEPSLDLDGGRFLVVSCMEAVFADEY